MHEGTTVNTQHLPRVGFWLFPDAAARDLLDAVVMADQAGVDECWIADEAVSREPVTIFGAAAPQTTHIKMGVGITSPAIRHPGAMASSIATLDELSGGRAILGFGVGGTLSLDPFGLKAERPVALVRDAIRTARAVIERQPSELYAPPAHAAPGRSVPIFVGSRGEQINKLASREADGVFFSSWAIEALGTAVEWARSVRPIHVAMYPSVRFRSDGPDDPAALRGDPATVAAGMVELVRRHRPESIGLALVDGDRIPQMVDSALEAIRLYRAAITR